LEKIRVLIADDHPIFRQGLRGILEAEPDIDVVGEASDGKQAIALARAVAPDVILVDVHMPNSDGLEVARTVKLHLPRAGIILMTAYDDEEQLFQAIKVGASAFFLKDIRPDEMLDGIRRAAAGEYLINESVLTKPLVASRVLKQFRDLSMVGQEMEPLFVPLSAREIEVLDYIARGNSNKEIARALKISDQTVKNHITSILRKLAVNDRTQAVVYALRAAGSRCRSSSLDEARRPRRRPAASARPASSARAVWYFSARPIASTWPARCTTRLLRRSPTFALHLQICERAIAVDVEHGKAELVVARAAIGEAINRLRAQVFRLRPLILEEVGVASTLRRYVGTLPNREGLAIEVVDGLGATRLDKQIELGLYRVAHAALDNAIAHAGARKVVVDLRAGEGSVELSVSDDGRGFDLESTRQAMASAERPSGIQTIQDWAEALNAELEITTDNGGTRVRVLVPTS
jgi:DNA-binding NarL/FixJ family response regulator